MQMTHLAVSNPDNKFPELIVTHTADPGDKHSVKVDCSYSHLWQHRTKNSNHVYPLVRGGGGGGAEVWVRCGKGDRGGGPQNKFIRPYIALRYY
jgi:hypothetical protein